jgi:hypothetical protein
MGPITIDPKTNHATLTPFLGRINDTLGFDIVEANEHPIAADPYLINFDAKDFAERVATLRTRKHRARLKVVK